MAINGGSGYPSNKEGDMLTYSLERVKTHCADYGGAQSNVTTLTPSANKKLEILGVYISTDDKLTDASVQGDTTGVVFKVHTSATAGAATAADMHKGMQIDEPLKITCGAGTFILVNYYEE